MKAQIIGNKTGLQYGPQSTCIHQSVLHVSLCMQHKHPCTSLAQDQVFTCVVLFSAIARMEQVTSCKQISALFCTAGAAVKPASNSYVPRSYTGPVRPAANGALAPVTPLTASRPVGGAYYALPAVSSSRYTYTDTRPLLHTCACISPLPAILSLAAIYQRACLSMLLFSVWFLFEPPYKQKSDSVGWYDITGEQRVLHIFPQ